MAQPRRRSSRSAKAAPAKKRSRKGATRKSAPVPGWVWLATGLALGLFITLIVYLVRVAPEAKRAAEVAAKEQRVKAIEEKKKKADEARKNKTRYDFYTMLPQEKVEVANTTEDSTEPAWYQFMLITGAFSSVADADRIRAELIMQGFEAQIKTATSDKGATVHRVVVGPFPNRSKMAKARSMLIAKGVASMMINAPKPPAKAVPKPAAPAKP